MKHANVALFIPFNGCPHRCSFCDQRSITGKAYQPTEKDVKTAIETALNSLKENTIHSEIAFFGGSFTALDREYMLSLLSAAKPYISRFKGIRISTRPDCIDKEILSTLKSYGVSAVELGAQSMNDTVLSVNERGHTAEHVRKAAELIKSFDIELGLQMMTGLFGSTPDLDRQTASEFISMSPDTVRIYPTIVMRGTRLGELYLSGDYKPMTLDESVELCAELITLFEGENIKVIRVGLHDTDSLKTDKLAGAYHPAFRELCESKIMLNTAKELLQAKPCGKYTLAVSPKSRSKMTGNKRSNLSALKELGYEIAIAEDPKLFGRQIVLL